MKKKIEQLSKTLDLLKDKKELKEKLKVEQLAKEIAEAETLFLQRVITDVISKHFFERPEILKEIAGTLVKIQNKETPTAIDIANIEELASAIATALGPYPTEIAVNNFPEPAEFPSTMEVTSPSFGATVRELGLIRAILDTFSVRLDNLNTGNKDVFVTNKTEKEAIPVKLVTKDGKYFYDAMVRVMAEGAAASDELLQGIIDAVNGISFTPQAAPTTLGSGRKVVAVTGTAVVLGASTTTRRVIISALTTNSDVVVVGGSGIIFGGGGNEGLVLFPGGGATFEIDNLNKVYVNGTMNDGVSFVYEA